MRTEMYCYSPDGEARTYPPPKALALAASPAAGAVRLRWTERRECVQLFFAAAVRSGATTTSPGDGCRASYASRRPVALSAVTSRACSGNLYSRVQEVLRVEDPLDLTMEGNRLRTPLSSQLPGLDPT